MAWRIEFSPLLITPNNNGGYDYDLVSQPPDRLVCKVCRLPSRDPYLSVCCGHVFCKSCLDGVKKATTITNACPVCRNEEFVTFPQKEANREIKSLHIYCTNKEKGCEWQGELNDINNHLGNSDGCQFEEVKCSNECRKMIQRQYLTSHVETECPCRKVNCQYCHDTGEHQFIEGQHKEECPKLPLPCPNKCGVGNITYKDMEAHRKECPLEMIQCEYYSVGCEVRMARKDQQKHESEKVKEHLMKTSQVMTSIKDELNGTKLELTIKSAQAASKHELTDTNSKLANTERRLTETKATLTDTNSKLANTERRLTDTKATLTDTKATLTDTNSKLANTERRLTETKATLADTNSKLARKLTETSNQLAIALQRINTLEVLLYVTTNKTVIRPTSSAVVLQSSVGWSDKLVAIATMSKSGDRLYPALFKMSEYNNKRTNKISWYSNFFYTHNRGYKMCLCIDIGGVGKGKGSHLSVYLYLMKGPYDDELTWPLRGKFEIKLLNQISDSEHHSIILAYDDNTPHKHTGRITKGDRNKEGWGCSQYISNEDLNKITPTYQFLKDDCLFFQVTKL